jgi:hypothetical protein
VLFNWLKGIATTDEDRKKIQITGTRFVLVPVVQISAVDHLLAKDIIRLSVLDKTARDLDALPEDIVYRPSPQSVTLNIKTPRIDLDVPFEIQIPQIEQVTAAAYRLLPYAKAGTGRHLPLAE